MADPEYPVVLRAGACANGETICWQLMVGGRVAMDMYSSEKDPAVVLTRLIERTRRSSD